MLNERRKYHIWLKLIHFLMDINAIRCWIYNKMQFRTIFWWHMKQFARWPSTHQGFNVVQRKGQYHLDAFIPGHYGPHWVVITQDLLMQMLQWRHWGWKQVKVSWSWWSPSSSPPPPAASMLRILKENEDGMRMLHEEGIYNECTYRYLLFRVCA